MFTALGTLSSAARLSRYGPEIFFYGTLSILLLVFAVFTPHRGARWFRKVESALARLAGQPARAIIVTGLLSLSIAVALTLAIGLPQPKVDDEFSYLLAADTFAHGRLTNPPHPLWVHFETFHTIQQPTYASKYPPGQGLILALGQILGHPIIGAWLGTAFACSAICWMLLGWVRARWAIVGALFAVVHPEILFWGQRYWGGSLALAGGALALGGFRRVMPMPQPAQRPLADVKNHAPSSRPRDATVMALGIAILSVTRPYEGGVLTLILLLTLVIGAISWEKSSWLKAMIQVGCPLAVVLTLTAVGIGYYNRRVTGNVFRTPYQVYVSTYNAAPVFIWQKPPPMPTYNHKEMRDFHTGWDLRNYSSRQTLRGFLTGQLERSWKLVRWHLRLWLLLLPLLALPWALKDFWMKVALLIWTAIMIAVLQVSWTFFHYAAPAFGLFFVLAAQSLRYLRLWRWRSGRVGLFLARGCLILIALSPLLTCVLVAADSEKWAIERSRIIAQLQQQGGKHLIIVRYASKLPNFHEWVYNGADINGAQVIWAREMDAGHNRDLLNFFKDRRAWLLQVDARRNRLLPYSVMDGLQP
jgi:hypothetical protein